MYKSTMINAKHVGLTFTKTVSIYIPSSTPCLKEDMYSEMDGQARDNPYSNYK